MHRPAGDSEAGSAAAGALLSQGCGRKEEGKPPVRGGGVSFSFRGFSSGLMPCRGGTGASKAGTGGHGPELCSKDGTPALLLATSALPLLQHKVTASVVKTLQSKQREGREGKPARQGHSPLIRRAGLPCGEETVLTRMCLAAPAHLRPTLHRSVPTQGTRGGVLLRVGRQSTFWGQRLQPRCQVSAGQR